MADAQLGEETALDLDDLLFGVEDLGFVFLQLRGGEALGADQGLLALVIGGRMLQVGLADLNVKAEDVVELDLERVDAGAFALALLDLRDVVLAVAADVAEFVELGVEPALDDSAIVEGDGRLGEDGALNALAHVGEFVEQIAQGGKARGREVLQRAADAGGAWRAMRQGQECRADSPSPG